MTRVTKKQTHFVLFIKMDFERLNRYYSLNKHFKLTLEASRTPAVRSVHPIATSKLRTAWRSLHSVVGSRPSNSAPHHWGSTPRAGSSHSSGWHRHQLTFLGIQHGRAKHFDVPKNVQR